MAEKTFLPEEIANQPLPSEAEAVSQEEARVKDVYTPESIPDQEMPKPVIARNVLSDALNTLARRITGILRIGKQGAIQIGDYQEGVSGKIRLDAEGFHGFDTSDKERIKILREGGIRFRGSNTITFYPLDSGNPYGSLGVWEGVGGLAGVYLGSNYWLNLSAAYAIACFSDLEVGKFTYPSPGWEVKFSVDKDTGNTVIKGTLNIDGLITGTITHALYADECGGNGGIPDYAYAAGCLVDLFDEDRVITAWKSGDELKFNTYKIGEEPIIKTAIVPTSKGFRSLYCMESPEVWFMDFCYGIKKRKFPKFWQTEWEIRPSKLFLETVEPPIIVMETLQKGVVQIWGKRKGFKNKRFEEKTKEQFKKNNEFWNTPNK